MINRANEDELDQITTSNCCGIESNDWHEFNGVKEGFCPDCKEHCEFETNDEDNSERREMMSKPDTNQASEDELRAEILTEFRQVHKLAPADYTENCTNVVMSLIRTEKLKLLAEVRERAQSMPIHGGTDSYSPSKYVQAVSIDALTKLEAEL